MFVRTHDDILPRYAAAGLNDGKSAEVHEAAWSLFQEWACEFNSLADFDEGVKLLEHSFMAFNCPDHFVFYKEANKTRNILAITQDNDAVKEFGVSKGSLTRHVVDYGDTHGELGNGVKWSYCKDSKGEYKPSMFLPGRWRSDKSTVRSAIHRSEVHKEPPMIPGMSKPEVAKHARAPLTAEERLHKIIKQLLKMLGDGEIAASELQERIDKICKAYP